MGYGVDHLMWAAPSLEAGLAQAQELFGIEAARGGSHPGLGTRNALVGLGETVYLEIIAPDPEQRLEGTFGARLQGLSGCGLVTWAAGCNALPGMLATAKDAGLSVRGPTATTRRTPDGEMLAWELLFVSGHEFAGLMPFFIDWLDTPHPAGVNPQAGILESLTLTTPESEGLRSLLTRLDVAVDVIDGSGPGIRAEISTQEGSVALQSTPETISLRF